MRILTQLTILAANRPGTLANICGTLSDEKINIIGLSVVDHVDYALIRMVVEDSQKALHLFGEAGLLVMEGDILQIDLKEGAGALEKVATILGKSGINIGYAYATEPSEDGDVASLILHTTDDQRALEILRGKV